MINEVLFMETRLLRQFREKYGLEVSEVNNLFNKFKIWDYIEECYDTLHTNGDDYILNDISDILESNGVHL